MKKNLYKFVIIAIISLTGCNSKNGLGLNENASVHNFAELSENPLLLNAITTSFQPKDTTMTVLYGNKLAYNYAKVSGDGNYPTGAVLYILTWKFQEDEQWFGANVPKNIKTIERLEILRNGETIYNNFEYNQIKQTNLYSNQKRINHIRKIKMAVSP